MATKKGWPRTDPEFGTELQSPEHGYKHVVANYHVPAVGIPDLVKLTRTWENQERGNRVRYCIGADEKDGE